MLDSFSYFYQYDFPKGDDGLSWTGTDLDGRGEDNVNATRSSEMRQYDRTSARSQQTLTSNPDGAMTDPTRAASQSDVERARAAIDTHLEKALSGNSRAFLKANRQTGGQ